MDWRVRHEIYQHFAATGRAPSAGVLAERVGASVPDVEAALERLAAAHAIVLAPGSTNIWMAHPFSAVPTAYPVRTADRTYRANCAWDALGIAVVLNTDTVTPTTCADCGEPLHLEVRNGTVEADDLVVHFLVPPRSFWENVGFT